MTAPKVLRQFFNEIFSQSITNIRQAYRILNVTKKEDAYRLLEKEYQKYNQYLENEISKIIIQRSKEKAKQYVNKIMAEAKKKTTSRNKKSTKVLTIGISLYLQAEEGEENSLFFDDVFWNKRSRSNGTGASFYLELSTVKYNLIFRQLNSLRYVVWNSNILKNKMYNKFINIVNPFQNFDDFNSNLMNLQQSRDKILIHIEEMGYEKKNNTTINYVDATAFDDYSATFLSHKYMSIGEELYNSEYVKDNYLKRSCWLNLIVDTFKKPIEKYYKNVEINHKFVHNILKPNTLLQPFNNGYSFNEVKAFFIKYKVALYMFDINDNIVAYYEPEKRNRNINPEIIYVLFHNKHIFRFNNNLKSLEQKIVNYLNKLNEICPKPSSKYYLKEGNEEQHTTMINSYNELMNLINNNNTEDDEIRVLYNKPSCFDLWLELYNNGIEASVLMTKGEVCFKFLRLLNVTNSIGKEKNILIYTLDEDGVYSHKEFETQEIFNNYMNKTIYASNYLLTTNYISSYNSNVNVMLDRYMKAPLIGKFQSAPKKDNNKCIHIDFNKYYTSILNEIKEFPIINSFDDFVDYTGEELKDYNLYFVEKQKNDEVYPFHKFSLCYGMNIKEVKQIKILKVLNISKTKKNNSFEIIKNLYNDNKLNAKMRKDIINHIVGKYNKKLNKKYYSSVSTDQTESNEIKSTYGGSIYKQTISLNTEEELDDDFDEMEYISKKYQEDRSYEYDEDTFLIDKKNKLNSNIMTLYINQIENERPLDEGFRLISLMIYDIAHKRLLNLKQTIETKYKLNVYGCNTDCLYLENDLEKFKLFQNDCKNLFNFKHKDDYDGIGKIKIEMEKHFCMNSYIKHSYNENICNTLNFTKQSSKIIPLKNEFDTDEIAENIDMYKNVIITADVAGAGKTTNFINHAIKYKKKTLIVAPYNTLCLDLNKKTKEYDGLVESITIHKLLGIVFDGKEASHQGTSYDVDDVSCIVFDEIYLLNTNELMKVNEFMNKHTKISFCATGDEYQNAPIDNNLYIDKDKIKSYYNNIVSQLFPYKIVLRENKRCKTDKDRQIMKDLSNDIRSIQNKNDVWNVFKKYNIKITDKISTKRNVCALNNTCEWVNNQLSNILHKDEKYFIGQQLVCRKTIKQGKIRTYINFTYTITKITEDTFVLDDGIDTIIELKKNVVINNFKFPYARTCHSYQGLTEDQPITIFDIDNFMVDKYWIYTALTRTTSIENIRIFKNNNQNINQNVNNVLHNMVAHHYFTDLKRFNACNIEDFITVEWINNEIQNVKVCQCCKSHLDINDYESFSVDRVDNNLPHIKMNCQIICRRCNVSKK